MSVPANIPVESAREDDIPVVSVPVVTAPVVQVQVHAAARRSWTFRISAAGGLMPGPRLGEVRVGHQPGCPPSVTSLRDTLHVLGYHPFEPDLHAWVTEPRRAAVYAARDPELVDLAAQLAEHEPLPAHPMRIALRWFEIGIDPADATAWVRAQVLYPEDAQVLTSIGLAPEHARSSVGLPQHLHTTIGRALATRFPASVIARR